MVNKLPNSCTHPALLRPIDPLQQQRALALLLRILRSKPYRTSRWIRYGSQQWSGARWLRCPDTIRKYSGHLRMGWHHLKKISHSWWKVRMLGYSCLEVDLHMNTRRCKWRIQGKWGLCWEHFQLSHSRALSWAVFLFWSFLAAGEEADVTSVDISNLVHQMTGCSRRGSPG